MFKLFSCQSSETDSMKRLLETYASVFHLFQTKSWNSKLGSSSQFYNCTNNQLMHFRIKLHIFQLADTLLLYNKSNKLMECPESNNTQHKEPLCYFTDRITRLQKCDEREEQQFLFYLILFYYYHFFASI